MKVQIAIKGLIIIVIAQILMKEVPIKIINQDGQGSNGIPVYTYKKECYRCKKETSIYTYCLFVSNQDSLYFPWDKHRLFKEQDFEFGIFHMKEPRIEFYPINLLGDFPNLDYMLRPIPYINSNQLTRISYLPTDTAFIVGELFPIPVEINVFDNTLDHISTTPEIKY